MNSHFADLITATTYVRQNGGHIELSQYGNWWVVVPEDDPGYAETEPHYGYPGHNPLCGDPNCRECVRLGWADVVEVEGVAAR